MESPSDIPRSLHVDDTRAGDDTSASIAMLDDAAPTLPGGSEHRRLDDSIESLRGRQIGRYVVLGKLGAGAMGLVVAAHDPELDRKIAIKLLLPQLGQRSDVGHRRLLAEAQALARLSDPNVVAVHDVGTHEDRVFVAMEFVEGQTLQAWLSAERRSWTQVLDVMIAAGRGLAAAHARGLVHRDFKPANVMIGSDGRVRVMDFGLALAQVDEASHDGEDDEHAQPRDLALGQLLTQKGALLGTPGYMAPEQLAGERGGPAADQFAFCVSVWEGLHGQRPFVAETLPELFTRIRDGKLEEPPRAARVPRWLRRAVERGLSAEPERRWPSMTELLGVLERGRARSRRRGALVLGLVAATAAVLVLATNTTPPCGGAELELQGIWDEGTRTAMAEAFASTGMPYAEDARRSAEHTLDTYTTRWAELRTDTCEATRVRGDQSEALMDLRIGCLDGKLRDVAALTALLARADADVVRNAVEATEALPSLEGCRALGLEAASVPTPAAPEIAATVEDIRDRVAEAQALGLAGKFAEGMPIAAAALAAAHHTGHPPVIAEAAYLVAEIAEQQGAATPARDGYEEALYAAIASGHQRVEAKALIGLVRVWGKDLGDTEMALRYGRQAEAVLAWLGQPPELDAALALARGITLMVANRLEAALAELEPATGLVVEGLPSAGRIRLGMLNNIAVVHGMQGDYRGAIEAFTRALELAEAQLGPWHPTVGSLHSNLGITHTRLEDHERALLHARRGVEIFSKALGPEHPELGRAYHNLGAVQDLGGHYQAAYESFAEALRIKRHGLQPDHVSVATTANNVCDVLVQLGRPAEAVPYCEEALGIWTKVQGERSAGNIYGLVSLSDALLALGKPHEALPHARRALAIGEDAEIDPIVLAKTRFVAARAIWASGGPREEALALARDAKRGYETQQRPSVRELAKIEAWLADPA